MNKKIKRPLSALRIIGMIFTPLGALFVIVGAATIPLFKIHPESLSGKPEVFHGVFIGIGLIFVVLGIIFLYRSGKEYKMLQEAYDSGNYITARFNNANQDTNILINNRHPYIAEFMYLDHYTGIMHFYKSAPVMFDPTSALSGRDVKVYIHPNDPECYYVDIEEILPEIRMH